jgi:hypothetical protein
LLKMLSSSRLVERAINLALTPLATNIFPCYPTFATAPESDSSPPMALWCLRNEKREGDQSSTHNMHMLLWDSAFSLTPCPVNLSVWHPKAVAASPVRPSIINQGNRHTQADTQTHW